MTKSSPSRTEPSTRETTTLTTIDFNEISDKSLAKNLNDIFLGVSDPDVLTEGEWERVQRFGGRLTGLGKAQAGADFYKSLRAEIAYQIREERDFELFVNSVSGKTYRNWTEFREVLAAALRVSLATLADHIKMVQYGRQVLSLQEGQFPHVGGVTTMRHMLFVSEGTDARETDNMAQTVRPRTVKFREDLERDYPSETYPDMLREYFLAEVAHDYEDPGAINKPPRELAEQGRERVGAPGFRAVKLLDGYKLIGYRIIVRYPDVEVDGSTVIGQEEEFDLKLVDSLPEPVRRWLDRRLGVRD